MKFRFTTSLNPRLQEMDRIITLTVIYFLIICEGVRQDFSELGVLYANFKQKHFAYLNSTRIRSELVQDGSECGFACSENTSCFSYNLAAFPDIKGKLLCELLPSDKHRNSKELIHNPMFHHFSKTGNSPCFRNPCINKGKCVAKFEDDDYHCSWCPQFYNGKDCKTGPFVGQNCLDIKKRGLSREDGMYWLDPEGGSHSNAFLAYCDMTSHAGGWTMCYTTDEFVKPKTEVAYNASIPYRSVGYRSNCNYIPFTEIMFVDHQTGESVYFKRRNKQSIRAYPNYDRPASNYELWDGVGAASNYSYQLLICDQDFYSGFLVSGYKENCDKNCNYWCGDASPTFFRTAYTNVYNQTGGVAFGGNGHAVFDKRRICVGLR